MSRTAYLIPLSLVCLSLSFSTGCDVEGEQLQDSYPNSIVHVDDATTAYDDTLRRLQMEDFEQHKLGIEADSRVDITHASEAPMLGLVRLLELKPFDSDEFSLMEVDGERISTTQQASALLDRLPCDLEYLAIDDIYSGQPINISWIAGANTDYEIYLDIYEKSADEPVYSLTQDATQATVELSGQLKPQADYEVTIEVVNHSAHQICATSSLLPSIPEDNY